jgi:predicted  nucleic acid-binding Zn-ribbon protein
MGIFDTLKNAVFESDGATAPTQTPAPAKAQPTPQGVQAPGYKPMGAGMVYPAQSTAVNQDMFDAIRKQTFSRNTALTSLITASDALKSIIPDPVVRLKAAQIQAGNGRGAKELSEAVQIHLTDVDSAERQFTQALDQKVREQVGGLQAQAASAEQSVKSATAEIQSLQQRMQQLQASIGDQTANMSNFQAEAAAKEAELRQAGVDFKAAADAVRQELNTHKETILSTLG